ncbi:hypothetical protein CBS101457_000888 [Exobasidium rhododendri]|nr:hypothetical protein CBS101457_000888 [Exobasidium rhododendri]
MASTPQEHPTRRRRLKASDDSLGNSMQGSAKIGAAPYAPKRDSNSRQTDLKDGQFEADGMQEEEEEEEENDDQDEDEYEDSGDISILQDNIMKQSRTIDDFTRIIADWRNEREKRQKGDGASNRTSFYGGDNAGASTSALGVRGLHVKGSALSLRREAELGRQSLDVDAASQYSYEPSSSGEQDDVGVSSAAASPVASLSPLALQDENSSSSKTVKVRCTCCCGRGTRRCKRARRATREWSEVESDLRLAAEIGQALLRKNDGLQSEVHQNQHDYSNRIDSLMKKLSSSIREASMLEKEREQSEMNLEAADASNRSLVRELDECRREVVRLRGATTRNTNLESTLERSIGETKDLKQELSEQKKKTRKMEKMHFDVSNDLRIALIEGKRQAPSGDGRTQRREQFKTMAEVRSGASPNDTLEESKWAEGLVTEMEEIQVENQQLREMLEARGEELVQLREDWSHRDGMAVSPLLGGSMKNEETSSGAFASLSSEIIEANESSPLVAATQQSPSRSAHDARALSPEVIPAPSLAASIASDTTSDTVVMGRSPTLLAAPITTHKATKELRTAQLMALLEAIQRIFTRLSNADVETLSKRLQRQNLTGDVGHLARTTVNGILKDVDGLKDQFRRGMEAESRNRDADTVSVGSKNSNKSEKESESLIAKAEFFALIRVFRELFIEMATLRKSVNEISLQPQHAARILQEQLGLKSSEDKGMGAWIGRMFSGTAPLAGVSTTTAGSISSSSAGPALSAATSPLNATSRPPSHRVTSGPQLTSRASAAVLPSIVAVEVKGTHATAQKVADDDRDTITSPPSHSRPTALLRNKRSLSRIQSRNLSGLFVGSVPSGNDEDATFSPSSSNNFGSAHTRLSTEQPGHRQHRLSRIVDDDEVSIHQSFTPKMSLRPRNLSDSSIRTTYMEDENKFGRLNHSTAHHKAPAAISRIITPSTLSLQASSSPLDTGVIRSSTSSTFSDDTSSTISTKEMREVSTTVPFVGGFLSGLAPRPVVSKALSFLSGPSLTPPAPRLRTASSSAKLSLAAAASGAASGGGTEGSSHQNRKEQGRTGEDDLLRDSQNRARELGI